MTSGGYHSVTPWIVSDDTAALIDYLRAAFGAEERGRMHDEQGRIGHAEVRIGDSTVMLLDDHEGGPRRRACCGCTSRTGTTFGRAVATGGVAVTEMTELAFGDRVGRVRDQSRSRQLTPEEMAERARDPAFAAAMRHVQDSLDADLRRR